jgi:hypothetical protein
MGKLEPTAACSVAIAFLNSFASRLMTGSAYMPAYADLGKNAAAASIAAASFILYVYARVGWLNADRDVEVEAGGLDGQAQSSSCHVTGKSATFVNTN